MDFNTNNNMYTYVKTTEEPQLQFQSYNQWERMTELSGASESLWQPYTK